MTLLQNPYFKQYALNAVKCTPNCFLKVTFLSLSNRLGIGNASYVQIARRYWPVRNLRRGKTNLTGNYII